MWSDSFWRAIKKHVQTQTHRHSLPLRSSCRGNVFLRILSTKHPGNSLVQMHEKLNIKSVSHIQITRKKKSPRFNKPPAICKILIWKLQSRQARYVLNARKITMNEMLSIRSQSHLLKSINRASFQLVRCQIKCKKRLTKWNQSRKCY